MDPNETLARIRELVDQLLHPEQPDTDPRVIEVRADRLAEHFRALDEWLMRGGFRPRAWSQARTFSGQRVGQVEFDLITNGLTNCPLSPVPHTILLVDDHGHTDPHGPLDPLGPPNPAHGDLPDRDDDYTPEGINRTGE